MTGGVVPPATSPGSCCWTLPGAPSAGEWMSLSVVQAPVCSASDPREVRNLSLWKGLTPPLRLRAPSVLATVLSRVLHWGPHLPQGATSLSELHSEPCVPNPQVTLTLRPRPASVGSLLLGLQPRAGVAHVGKSRRRKGSEPRRGLSSGHQGPVRAQDPPHLAGLQRGCGESPAAGPGARPKKQPALPAPALPSLGAHLPTHLLASQLRSPQVLSHGRGAGESPRRRSLPLP